MVRKLSLNMTKKQTDSAKDPALKSHYQTNTDHYNTLWSVKKKKRHKNPHLIKTMMITIMYKNVCKLNTSLYSQVLGSQVDKKS